LYIVLRFVKTIVLNEYDGDDEDGEMTFICAKFGANLKVTGYDTKWLPGILDVSDKNLS